MRAPLFATVAAAALLGVGGAAMAQAPEKADHNAPTATSAPSAAKPSGDRRSEEKGQKNEAGRASESVGSHSAREGGATPSQTSDHSATHEDKRSASPRDARVNENASPKSGATDARVGSAADHRTDGRAADEGQKTSPKAGDQSQAQKRDSSPDGTKSDSAKSNAATSGSTKSDALNTNGAASKANSAQTDQRNVDPARRNADRTKAGTDQESSHSADRNANDKGSRGDAASADSSRDHAHITLTGDKEKRVMETIRRDHVENITKVDFDVHVGTVVPTHYRFHPLPPTIVEYAPQYRGYDYVLVDDTIVIIQPHTHRIVDTIEENRTSAMNQPADCR